MKRNTEYNRLHKGETAKNNAERALRIKTQIISHYGNGKLACVRCGYDNIGALSIDHINGNGGAHRKQVGSGVNFYKWLIDNKYPSGYQTLCMNCQFLKRIENKEQTRYINKEQII